MWHVINFSLHDRYSTTGKAVLRDILSIMAREWHKIFELRFKNIHLKCTRGFHLSSRSQTADGLRSGKLNWLSTALRTIFPSQTTLWLTRSSLKDHFFGRNSFEDLQYRSQIKRNRQWTQNTSLWKVREIAVPWRKISCKLAFKEYRLFWIAINCNNLHAITADNSSISSSHPRRWNANY